MPSPECANAAAGGTRPPSEARSETRQQSLDLPCTIGPYSVPEKYETALVVASSRPSNLFSLKGEIRLRSVALLRRRMTYIPGFDSSISSA